jgi:hypothetical protein
MHWLGALGSPSAPFTQREDVLATPPGSDPVTTHPLFWAGIGGVALVAAIVAVAALSGSRYECANEPCFDLP